MGAHPARGGGTASQGNQGYQGKSGSKGGWRSVGRGREEVRKLQLGVADAIELEVGFVAVGPNPAGATSYSNQAEVAATIAHT